MENLAVDGSSNNPPQTMVLPREVFHKTYIWVPIQEAFDLKIIKYQFFILFNNANFHNEYIILKSIPICTFLVYNGFNIYLDLILIYKSIKNLFQQDKPDTQALLTFLIGCITGRIFNDTVTVIP